MNLPTKITVCRLALAGVFLAAMSLPWQYPATTALAIFAVATATDWLDGYLARQYNMVSDLGKLLDPLADKILISAALVSLVEREIAPMWMAVLIISREFLITGLRQLAAKRQVVMAAERAGKHKTMTQMTAIITSLVYLALRENGLGQTKFARIVGMSLEPLYWLAIILTVGSGFLYFYKNQHLFENES
jgi:CDP-diacylglycerol--glycerol-3-phosphate 3-phosphatidyltransferase